MRPRTIAIGDIHGCSRALEAVLAAIGPRREDVIVTLGDYINRGPDSRGVLDWLIALEGQCTLIPILGNHEQQLLAALDGEPSAVLNWLDMGGVATLASYGAERVTEADLARIPAEHIAFLRRCRDYYETESQIFVHAQYVPDMPMDEQSPLYLRWESLRDGTPGPPALRNPPLGRYAGTRKRRRRRPSAGKGRKGTGSKVTSSATATRP
jgi:Calcineurin-like phosphoesterase